MERTFRLILRCSPALPIVVLCVFLTCRHTEVTTAPHARILPRRSWRPSLEPEFTRMAGMGKPFRITVHHTGHEEGSPRKSLVASAAMIRGIQKAHIKGRGWKDIGYHFIIDRVGRIWEARPLQYRGAHAGNAKANRGNVGIALLGNFEDRPPTQQEQEALVWLIRWLCDRYAIAPRSVFCHCDFKATRCPGGYLVSLVRTIQSRGFL